MIWVVDSVDKRRLQDCKDELEQLLKEEVIKFINIYFTCKKLAGASILIFANKQDVQGALSSNQIKDVLELEGQIGTNRHWAIQSCSAVSGEGLLEGVEWLINDIASRIFMLE